MQCLYVTGISTEVSTGKDLTVLLFALLRDDGISGVFQGTKRKIPGPRTWKFHQHSRQLLKAGC